ncbi:hypothetical protein [Niabella drilacis]|uniref:Uncharacterized protein n=1 Tax=Niabella drilacis (strain DSM 25811 / CCM 8410 / CCUG 62505 / LMG 26954 / E90) TaxID=1285928 RepID=A0A1G6KP78_NIADE|nr:hypothetical protein [Niabella drilacis]SDC32697.1 hypothetical protein SAMN04487894_10247 [Niabella drilacis]
MKKSARLKAPGKHHDPAAGEYPELLFAPPEAKQITGQLKKAGTIKKSQSQTWQVVPTFSAGLSYAALLLGDTYRWML